MDARLDDATIEHRLGEVPDWSLRDDRLERQVRFGDFSEAFAFMTRVALIAEKLDHHPDWSNSWDRVSIAITGHAAGGITDRCFRFAVAVDAILG